MSSRRQSRRVVEGQPANVIEGTGEEEMKAYNQMIGDEIRKIVSMVIEDVVKKFTETDAVCNKEDLVFFRKMEGADYRSGAECSEGEQREEYKLKAEAAYGQASAA